MAVDAEDMTTTIDVCAYWTRHPQQRQPLLMERLHLSPGFRKKHIDRSSLFDLSAKRMRGAIPHLHWHTVFLLKHPQDFLKWRPEALG